MCLDDTAPEVWRSVVGYEGLYDVSSAGRVRNARTGYVRVPVPVTHGYYGLNLTRGSRASRTQVRIHVLVATAFIGPRPTPMHGVNHIDGIKTNNRPSNLEWATPAENNAHAGRMGLKPRGDAHPARLHPENLARGEQNGAYTKPESRRRGALNGRAKISEVAATEIRASTEKTRILAARYGVDHQAIYRIRSGQTWKHLSPPLQDRSDVHHVADVQFNLSEVTEDN